MYTEYSDAYVCRQSASTFLFPHNKANWLHTIFFHLNFFVASWSRQAYACFFFLFLCDLFVFEMSLEDWPLTAVSRVWLPTISIHSFVFFHEVRFRLLFNRFKSQCIVDKRCFMFIHRPLLESWSTISGLQSHFKRRFLCLLYILVGLPYVVAFQAKTQNLRSAQNF